MFCHTKKESVLFRQSRLIMGSLNVFIIHEGRHRKYIELNKKTLKYMNCVRRAFYRTKNSDVHIISVHIFGTFLILLARENLKAFRLLLTTIDNVTSRSKKKHKPVLCDVKGVSIHEPRKVAIVELNYVGSHLI